MFSSSGDQSTLYSKALPPCPIWTPRLPPKSSPTPTEIEIDDATEVSPILNLSSSQPSSRWQLSHAQEGPAQRIPSSSVPDAKDVAEASVREKTPLIGVSSSPPESPNSSNGPHFNHWPKEAKKLRETGVITMLFTSVYWLLSLAPAAFLVLCGLVACIDGSVVEGNVLGNRVATATQLGPTIFPMLFAAVAGRTLKLIAGYSAERGAKLGTLEMLMASQTVWGTFESQFLLRKLTTLGAHLLVLWCLSPLGGQASLRILETSVSMNATSTMFRYLDTSDQSAEFSCFGTATGTSQSSAINSIYVSLLLSPHAARNGTQDIWGNFRLPRIESIETSNHLISNPGGWYNVPDSDSPDAFSSLVGTPTVGLPGLSTGVTGDTLSFVSEHSYMSLSCSAPNIYEWDDPAWQSQLGLIWSKGSKLSNDSPFYVNVPYSLDCNQSTSFFLDTNTVLADTARINEIEGIPLDAQEALDPALNQTRQVIFGTRTPSQNNSLNLAIFDCTVTQIYVEANVSCSAGIGCEVKQLRRSLMAVPPKRFTPLEFEAITVNMFQSFPLATGYQTTNSSSPAEAFIMNSTASPYGPKSVPQYDYIDLSIVSPDLVASRLSTLLNTYYQLSLAPSAFTGDLPTNLSVYGPANATSSTLAQDGVMNELFESPMVTREALAMIQSVSAIYRCARLWFVILVGCSSILLLLGIGSLALSFESNAPDMLGFVSSLTHRNPYIQLPQGTGPLDGMERARVLRGLKVQIADVEGTAAVGSVAFVALNDASTGMRKGPPVRRLEKHRLYI